MSTEGNNNQEIWKKFNKPNTANGAPKMTPQEEKKFNLREATMHSRPMPPSR